MINIENIPMKIDGSWQGLVNDPSDWMSWALIVMALLLVALSAWLIYIYWSLKSSSDALRGSVQDKSWGSFKGFWGRYRGAIILFLAIVILIIAIYFVAMGIFGIVPDSELGGV